MTTTFAPSATCWPASTATSATTPARWRDQDMLHLHRLDDGEPLPLLDCLSLATNTATTLPCIGDFTSPPLSSAS